MGEVYRARDTRLDRDVAIKVLPEALARDRERVLRFEREAKLLASLNHTNIAHIYGFEESDDQRFLVLEYVDGETLAARLKRGPMPIEEALDVAGRIAEALEAAHNRDVVHRDLKPGNVMIAADGAVKVLDFGLARTTPAGCRDVAAAIDSPTITADYTRPGVVLGTAPYMSPEQARGRAVDKRTDIWSFGVILYECLTGKMLFGGETTTDSITAVLHMEPDWNRLPAKTPRNVRRLLSRCVVRDLRDRLHDIADVRIELEQSEPESDEGPRPAPRVGTVRGALAAAVLMIVAFSLWTVLRGTPKPTARAEQNPLARARFSRITDFPGSEFDAAISPDGRFVAFVSDRNGPLDIFVSQVDTAGIRRLSSDAKSLALADNAGRVAIGTIGFNPDGSEIWFRSGSTSRVRAVPLLGGAVRNLFAEGITDPAWSRDGAQIVYHLPSPGDPVYVANRDGTNSRVILESSEGVHQHFSTWSVDDQWIYLVRGRLPLEMDLWRVRPDGRDAERLTRRKLDVRYPTPIDKETVLYCALDSDGAGPWLWALDVKKKISRRASIGMEQYRSVAASADGRRLVATLWTPREALWTVPILDRVATEDDAKKLPGLETSRALAPRMRGPWLFYLSSRGSGDGLWRYRDGTNEEIWRGSTTPLLEPAAVSPDGQSVAVILRREDRRRVYVLNANGSKLEPLTDSVDARGAAAWSPDGQWIVVGGSEAGILGLFKIPTNGGDAEQIAEGEAVNPIWSPKGDLIVYAGPEVGPRRPLRAVRPNGVPVTFPEILVVPVGERARFLPDGSGLVYMAAAQRLDFWLVDLDTMKRRQLTKLEPGTMMRTFDVTPDGTRIVFDRLTEDSDIVLIERKTPDSAIAGEE
jgi:serine/threonine protein kinase